MIGIGWLILFPTFAPQAVAQDEASVPVEAVLALCEAENDVVRAFWTKEIVGPGIEVGLAFRGDWRDPNIEAGPLPALFLQATADNLAKTPIRLGLRLGSDFPIQARNRFEGVQLLAFQKIKRSSEPQFFYAQDTDLYTAMFPDLAVAGPCVSCHNTHRESPKRDWQLNDVMGATTWTYPSEAVAGHELTEILEALRQAIREAYAAYIDKAASFAHPPEIGDKWPRDGYYLPTADLFMVEVGRLIPTLDALALGE
ncbi:MAG: c-type heme family protein [Geminicoccaceae bacterium]